MLLESKLLSRFFQTFKQGKYLDIDTPKILSMTIVFVQVRWIKKKKKE